MSTNNLFSNEKRGNARNVIAVLDKIKKETIKYTYFIFENARDFWYMK